MLYLATNSLKTMKKLLLSISAVIAATSAMAQAHDIEAVLTVPTEGSTQAPNASQQFNYNIKNNGPTALSQGDTIYFGYAIGTTPYTMTGVAGSASGAILPQAVASGASLSVSQNPITINTSGITTSTQVCAIVYGMGGSSLTAAGDPNETDDANNLSCFTVAPSTANLAEIAEVSVSVYPNPASDVLNIKSEEVVASVALVTMDGKVLFTGNSTSVNISTFNAGTYVYMVRTLSGETFIGNFVKN